MTIYDIIKRIFDLLVSLFCLIFTLPVTIVIAIFIKLSSKGPVLHTSIRVGKDRKPFKMYKFRSMHQIKRDAKGQIVKEEGFIANPQRIFRLGAFLRKSKLDELPQLVNVLSAQMSIVGPRPNTQANVEKLYTGRYVHISSIKPGLSCLDSLYDYAHGELFISDNEEYKREILPIKLELAKIYVEKRNIPLDIHIIARTLYIIVAIAIFGKKSFPYTKYERLAIDRIRRNLQEV